MPGFSWEENGVRVKVSPGQDQAALLFNTDCAAFKKQVGATKKKVCDCLFYVRELGKASRCPALVFVELKGTDAPRAVKQLESTARLVLGRLGGKCAGRRALGLVVSSASAPLAVQRTEIKRILGEYGLAIRVVPGARLRTTDVSQFIDDAACAHGVKTTPCKHRPRCRS